MAIYGCRLNAAEMYVDVVKDQAGVSTRWIAESGVVDVFFLLGPSPSDVASQVNKNMGDWHRAYTS